MTFGHWIDTLDCQRWVVTCLVTDAGQIRSSESSTETLGHWFDTVDRQRRSTETFCHWLDTADRQKWVHRRLVAG